MSIFKKISVALLTAAMSVSMISFAAAADETTPDTTEPVTEATDPTGEPGWYESQYVLSINSLPDKVSYDVGEKLDLKGLTVSLELYDQQGEHTVVFDNVSPTANTDAFIVDTSDYNNYQKGTYTIKISCTDKYQAFLETNTESFEVEVTSPIQEYSAFEAIRIRRDLLAEGSTYTAKNYSQVSKFLVNNSTLSIRYFTLSYDTQDCDLSNYEDPSVLDPTKVIYKSKTKIVVANLIRDGYVNSGWEYDGKVYTAGEYFTMPACDVVMTPVWHKRCQINYYAGDYDDINGNTSAYVMSAENAQFFLADASRFSRSGYVITGWNCSYDGKQYRPGEAFIVPAEDVTFEAVWSPAEYTVSVSANNGNSADKYTTKATFGEEFVLPECEFEYEGKTFAGWKYNGTIYQPGESFTVPALISGQKIVIVATWS